MSDNLPKFTTEEWNACIKVLNALKDDPFDNPDNQMFAGLVTKVFKNARKQSRQSSHLTKKSADLISIKESTIASNALDGKSSYFEGTAEEQSYVALNIPKNCYVCNTSYSQQHSFYNRLCPECASFNYNYRFLNVDLTGRTVILTGGRVKVGYSTALKLLRSGANLVLTSRFPAVALLQLQDEADYDQWKERLVVYGLDLRDLKAVERFVDYFTLHYDSLDILVNNAAQTIKYPDDYYQPLLQAEEQAIKHIDGDMQVQLNTTGIGDQFHGLQYSQNEGAEVGLTRFGQPIDNREKTSWNSLLDEVSLFELLEVNLINHISPYLLIKSLKPLMKRSSFADRYIINVTSSEGIFSHNSKTPFHPHTNMTKAALNMMTRTSGEEFAEDGIYMSAVDVGWISTGAIESLRQKQFRIGYIPPLDSVDGAARVLHPVAEGIKGGPYYGVLLKDYKIHTW